MTDQLSLLDPAARSTDPPTSHAAAAAVAPHAPAQRMIVLDAIVALDDRFGQGATAYEAQLWLEEHRSEFRWQQNVVSKRITDLVRLGLVTDSAVTRPGSSAVRLTVWFPTGASPP